MKSRLGELAILFIAACIGITTGLVASGFNRMIIIGTKLTRPILDQSPIMFFVFPVMAAILTAGLYKRGLLKKESGMGVVQVLFEMKSSSSQLMKPINVFWNIIATVVTLVFGMTAGRFGPITHLGAAIGANIGEGFNLEEDQIRLMMGCGAAGAIATVFNLPFFAALFVMEVMFRERYFKVLAPLIISAVISNQVGIYFLGDRVPLIVQIGNSPTVVETIMPFLILGTLAGLVAALYIACYERASQVFEHIEKRGIRLLIGAIAVGFSAYFLPEQFEIHFDTNNQIISGNFGIQILLALIFVRILTTALTLGAGFIGGNFYPGVTIGAALGVLVWKVLTLFNIKVPTQGEMGILGIVAMLAGFLHAPLACTVLALEISKNMNIATPAMIVTALSVTISYIAYGRDIFAKLLGKLISQSHHSTNE